MLDSEISLEVGALTTGFNYCSQTKIGISGDERQGKGIGVFANKKESVISKASKTF